MREIGNHAVEDECEGNSIAQSRLEIAVIDLVKQIYFSIEDEAALERAVREEISAARVDSIPESERLRAQVSEDVRTIRTLLDQLVKHPENEDVFNERIGEAKARKAAALKRIAEIDATRSRDVDIEEAVKATMEELRRWRGLFQDGEIDAQKEVIRTFVKEIRVNSPQAAATIQLASLSKLLVGPSRTRVTCRVRCPRSAFLFPWGARTYVALRTGTPSRYRTSAGPSSPPARR